MRQAQHRIEIATKGKGLYEINAPVRRWAEAQEMTTGLLTLFCQHTSASLLIQENADPDVQTDLLAYFERIAPEDARAYVHDAEGPDDMPAHLRAALTQTHLAIPLGEGRLMLGTWQGVYLFEHRRAPHRRQIVLHLVGS
jgi:secondary thiamine-phosphate synthase enzyme